jgi:SAM-dependent methyltransferase
MDRIASITANAMNKVKKFPSLIYQNHFTEADLRGYLKSKSSIGLVESEAFSDHLDNCLSCWHLWDKVRWDASIGSQGLSELQQYLGDKFDVYFDSSWTIASEWLRAHPKTNEEIASFYKTNTSYLYNLIVWFESGDRHKFNRSIDRLINRFKVRSVVDYGCGVGNDGLLMMQKGLDVNFVDYACPSIDFLRWRLKERSLKAKIFDVEKLKELPKVDMFWAIDVLEHMPDPLWVIDRLSPNTRVFVHRSEFGNDAGGRHPCHFNFDELKLGEALRRRGFKHIPWPVLSVWVR